MLPGNGGGLRHVRDRSNLSHGDGPVRARARRGRGSR